MVMNDTNIRPDRIQLLLVADTWCDAEHACEKVWETLGERPGKVFVISPVITGRLHSLADDIDKESAAAQRRLNDVLTQLRDRGYIASGRVGDEDPLRAIKDTLFDFRADAILVVTTAATDETWSERKLVERATNLGLPVSCVRVAEAAVQ
jgi:GABA permease